MEDWQLLKSEFIVNTECPSVRTWLSKKKDWSAEQIASGNTNEHIAGWGKERANYQQKIIDEATESMRQRARERIPRLYEAKFNLFDDLIERASVVGTLSEKKAILQLIKTELGEPLKIPYLPSHDTERDTHLTEIRDAVRAIVGITD